MFLFKEANGNRVVGTEKNTKFRFFIYNESFKLLIAEYNELLAAGAFLTTLTTGRAEEIIGMVKSQYNIDVVAEEFTKLDPKMELSFFVKE